MYELDNHQPATRLVTVLHSIYADTEGTYIPVYQDCALQ